MHFERGVDEVVPGPSRVIKSLAFSSDGRFLAVSAAGPDGVLVFDVSVSPVKRVVTPWDGDPAKRARHVAFFDSACVIYFGWGAPPRAACHDGQAFGEVPLPALPGDVKDVSARGSELLLTADADAVWRVTMDRERRVSSSRVPGVAARLVALSPDGARTAFAGRDTVQLGASSVPSPSPLSAMALADDGRLALCRLDGVVELRGAGGEVVFTAPAHEQRCARVAFCDGQRAVCSVGWDGRFRLLEAP